MLLAAASVLSAVAAGAAIMYRAFFPKLSIIEVAGAAAPLGLTLSAWLALLLKSVIFQAYVDDVSAFCPQYPCSCWITNSTECTLHVRCLRETCHNAPNF